MNTPTTHGSIGLTTGLDPAMTLGCGGFGGNITSDNISPRHLINIKRVAYELRPVSASRAGEAGKAGGEKMSQPSLPKAPAKPVAESISADSLTSRIDRFLSTRGLSPSQPSQPALPAQPAQPALPAQPEKFVCEDDVRQAVKTGRKILIGERTIVTPAARDAGEAAKVFLHAGWPQP